MKNVFNFFTIWISVFLSINIQAQSYLIKSQKRDTCFIILPDVTVKRDTIFVNKNIGSLKSIGSKSPATYFKNIQDYHEFLSKNLHKDFSPNETKGVLLMSFIIDKDGSVSNIKILKKMSRDADLEIKRVIKRMTKWKPAMRKKENLTTLGRITFYFDIEAVSREKLEKYISKNKYFE
ncbi:energy transducer TonB [Flavobacterium psychrophilum]|nr:energy transducer TonB [Flavobacterium psychrophilum]